ncbi:MAG: FecR domain-containing protein [Rhodospirillaceae bacterium]|nr:FecR domain-containing protein [Rhodospirillaceae bacterium]
MSIGKWFAGIVCGAALALAGAAPALAEAGAKAGVAAAVRGAVQQVSYRTPQAAVGRNVGSGDAIFLGDRIVTGAGAGLQIMLLDGTTFSIGPNSSMVIDEFVYDPTSGSGKVTASMTRGTLRLISGKIGRQSGEAIRVKLPVATVGVRGTVALFSGNPNGFFIGLFGIGPDNSADRPSSFLAVGINGTVYEIFRNGFGCTVTPANPVCNPQPIGPEFLQQILGQIAGNLRQVDLLEFERLTGIDLVQALELLQTQGGFDQLWQQIDQILQDQNRPGAPPPAPSCVYCCYSVDSMDRPVQFADSAGPSPPRKRGKRRGKQLAYYCP